MMGKDKYEGRIFELSSERQITGRRPIKIILHEIFQSRDVWQENGISWDETYTAQNLDSVAGMSICAEFISDDRRLPYGHGLTEIRDNMPLMENATVVGHCDRAYIADVEIDGETKRVLIAEGTIDEMRYPKFVEWLREKLDDAGAKGSVEIVGRPENENRIIYDGGWKEFGRVPQVYDYGGYAILGIRPADDTAIVMELNNKLEDYKEDTVMDEKLLNQFVESVKSTVVETITTITDREEQYKSQITELNNQLVAKDAEIAELNSKLTAATEDIAAKDQTITDQTTELNNLKEANTALENDKKIAELNSALSEFTEEQQALAKDEIEAFRADPASYEINSITSKICVEMVRKNKEAQAQQDNAGAPDIYGCVSTPEDLGDVSIY